MRSIVKSFSLLAPNIILAAILIAFILYKRYFPVFGLPCIQLKDLELDRITVIDVRDYNDSYKEAIIGAINIPISYLKRNLKAIPNKDLHLIVTSTLEKNLGTRNLRKHGFRVIGYTNINVHNLYLNEHLLNIKINC